MKKFIIAYYSEFEGETHIEYPVEDINAFEALKSFAKRKDVDLDGPEETEEDILFALSDSDIVATIMEV